MSCHYSCTSCVSQLFADQCLSCPATRQLIDTTCLCISSYYEFQQSACRSYEALTKVDYTFYLTTQIIYWIMLGFSWLIILGNLNHLYSAKVRVLVGWSQLLALLLEYRFRFSELVEEALDVFGVWNFRYFDKLLSCSEKSKPYQCQSYQNIIGPLLTLGAFFVAMVISYILTKTCILSIFTQQQQQTSNQAVGQVLVISRTKQTHLTSSSPNPIKSMSFTQYMRISLKQFFFLYLDYTIVQWSVQLSRIAYISNVWFLLYIPIIIFLILYSLYTLKIINSQSQFKVEYRSQLGYFYIYDQKYYLNYLDYLFEEQKRARSKGYKPIRYLPHSTYLILQLFIKFFIASTTIIMFEYKPQLWVFPTVIALLIGFIKLKVFQIYQRQALLCYSVGLAFYVISVALFFLQYFFTIWMIFLMFIVSTTYFVLLISELTDWTRAKQGKYWAVAYQYLNGETEDQQLAKVDNHAENNDGEINAVNENNSHDDLVNNKDTKINNGVIRSGQDVREKSDQQLKNIALNIMASNNQPIFKKNPNSTQRNSASNENLNLTQNSNLSNQQNPQNQNLKPNSPQQSFMTRTNRSKFAGLNSNDSFLNTKPQIHSSQGSLRGKNGKKNAQNDRLPDIIEEDKQESAEGRSMDDINRNTFKLEPKDQANMIIDLENNDSDHQMKQKLSKPTSPQDNAFKTSGKTMKSMRYKK